jgi:hypothetical protein
LPNLNKTWVNDKLGLAFVGTSSYTNFWTLVQVLLYGDIVHIFSCSLVHVCWHERVATFGNFYMEDANARLNWRIDLINHTTTHDHHGVHG